MSATREHVISIPVCVIAFVKDLIWGCSFIVISNIARKLRTNVANTAALAPKSLTLAAEDRF